jgi:aryl-alcohol dehydrogenase-like predicted oxidoreductase
MESTPLGRSGLEVQPLCLGTMTFGLQVDESGSFDILDHAFELGMRFLDTADAYPLGGGLETVGRTEMIIGKWMKSRKNRNDLVIASKCFAPTDRGPNSSGLSRQHIVQAVEQSLTRLDIESIDLYQSHAFDPSVPIEETLKAFDDLVRHGKVRYIGCSNYPAWRLSEALATSTNLGLEHYVSVQPRYNMLYREIETELLPLCRHMDLGVLVYNPMAGGFLSGKYKRTTGLIDNTRFTLGNAAERYQERYWHDAQFHAVDKFSELCSELDMNPVSVAIRWVLDQKGITSAIIGASRPDQLAANINALEIEIPNSLRELCDQLWWELPKRPVIEGYR